MQRASGPQQVLNDDRAIETIERAHLRLKFGGGVGGKYGGKRIAGCEMNQHEADDAHADRDRNDVEQAFDGVSEHGVVSRTPERAVCALRIVVSTCEV